MRGIFSARAPHQAGRSLQKKNHEPTLFLLAPRLPHVVQGAEDTGDSGCEVHYGSVGEESISQEFNCPVVPVSSDDAPGRRRHCCCIRALCSVQEVVDVETFQAVRQVTLALDVLLELQNEALGNAVAVGLLILRG